MINRAIALGTDLTAYGEMFDSTFKSDGYVGWFKRLTEPERELARKFPPMALVCTEDSVEGDAIGVVMAYCSRCNQHDGNDKAWLIIAFDATDEEDRHHVDPVNIKVLQYAGVITPEWVAKAMGIS